MRPKQESLLLRKEAFEKLSDEAKETALLILETPVEFLEALFTPKWRSFSKEKFKLFLRKRNGWSRKQTKAVLKELNNYIKIIVEES